MQGFVMVLFGIGMMGDVYTTFIGIVGVLGVKLASHNDPLGTLGRLSTSSNDFPQLALALIATSIIIGLNATTLEIIERKQKIIFPIWVLAVFADFMASLFGSFALIKPGANPFLSYGLVFIITIFITASPCLFRYFQKNPIY